MKQYILTNKKAQVWSLDLLVAFMIFTAGIIIVYFFAINYIQGSPVILRELFFEGELASSTLMSDEATGILSSGKINQTKLDEFDALTDQQKKIRLGVSNSFYFTIPDLEIAGVSKSAVGILNTTSTNNQVQTSRIVIYQNKPVKLSLISWN
ncbi:hypothetical protein KAR91_61620 [Candidatus Pacearchaeota archaeon]|nr:hypothetical protein [Candidatus Pacearchaeota archaeon]